jgi:hypothetical protein
LKRGGHVIYAGELGPSSHKLVEYFEVSSFDNMFGLGVAKVLLIFNWENNLITNMILWDKKTLNKKRDLELLRGAKKSKIKNNPGVYDCIAGNSRCSKNHRRI